VPPPLDSAESSAAPPVSVVICAFTLERIERIAAAVESLEAQTVAPREIVLVIDHSPQLEAECRRRWPATRVLANRERQGLSGARNTGLAESSGAVVAFLDDDAVAAEDWLEEIANAHRTHPSILGVGGWTEPAWERSQPAWFPIEFGWVVGASYRGLPDAGGPVRNTTGGNMSVDRRAYVEAGGFDVNLGKVGIRSEPEDTELCIRIGNMHPDRQWIFWPGARIAHKVPLERESFRYFLTRCRYEGLGKAALTAIAGGRRGLSSERTYALRILSSGVAIRIARGLRSRDYSPFAQAAVLVVGLAVTTAGFAEGLFTVKLRSLLGGNLKPS
jgi:glycosyltransferase involved in cell wall biosynthesis